MDGPGMNELFLKYVNRYQPDDFIELAYSLKKQLKTEYNGVLSRVLEIQFKKGKGYMKYVIIMRVLMHHLYQCSADNNGFIGTFIKIMCKFNKYL